MMGIRNKHTFEKGHKVSDEIRRKLSLFHKGRKLKEQICIHHINGNHEDNRPENRMIVTRSEHALIHNLQGDCGFHKGHKIRGGRPKKCQST